METRFDGQALRILDRADAPTYLIVRLQKEEGNAAPPKLVRSTEPCDPTTDDSYLSSDLFQSAFVYSHAQATHGRQGWKSIK